MGKSHDLATMASDGFTFTGAVTHGGIVTNTAQPAFSAKLNGNQSSLAPGDNDVIVFDSEIFDQGGNYATTGIFTAPVTGRYQFNSNLYINSVDADTSYYQMLLVTSNRTYYGIMDPRAFDQDAAQMSIQISVLADMDANDTAKVQLQLGGGGATQSSIYNNSNFSGYLVG